MCLKVKFRKKSFSKNGRKSFSPAKAFKFFNHFIFLNCHIFQKSYTMRFSRHTLPCDSCCDGKCIIIFWWPVLVTLFVFLVHSYFFLSFIGWRRIQSVVINFLCFHFCSNSYDISYFDFFVIAKSSCFGIDG